jgi:hypothetical protein
VTSVILQTFFFCCLWKNRFVSQMWWHSFSLLGYECFSGLQLCLPCSVRATDFHGRLTLLRQDLIFCLHVPRLGPILCEASAGQLLFLLTNPNLWSPAQPVLRFSEPATSSGTADLEVLAKIRPFVISLKHKQSSTLSRHGVVQLSGFGFLFCR